MVTAEDITGSWLLIEMVASKDQEAELLERYGEQPEGILILSPDGCLCAAICRGDRARLPGDPAWHTSAPEAARLAAFDSYLSLAGRWRIEDGKLITKVAFALNPNWVGGEQVRDVELPADGTMRLVATQVWPSGEAGSVWVDWRRAG